MGYRVFKAPGSAGALQHTVNMTRASMTACCIDDPEAVAEQVQGSDRRRIRKLWLEVKDPRHLAWLLIEDIELREDGYHAISDLVELLLGAEEASSE